MEVQEDYKTTSELIWPRRNYTRERTRINFWFVLHSFLTMPVVSEGLEESSYLGFWENLRKMRRDHFRTTSVFSKIGFKIIQRLSCQRMRIHPALILSLTWAVYMRQSLLTWNNEWKIIKVKLVLLNQTVLLNSVPFKCVVIWGKLNLDKTVYRKKRSFFIEKG